MEHPNLQIEKYFEQDEDGYTKLQIAILHNIEPAIQVLINYAPDASFLNIRNFSGQTALHLAVLMSQSQVVRKLIDAGADINVRDNRCNSPLHLAVLNQDESCVRTIIAAIYPGNKSLIANLEQWNYEGETCFYVASKLRDIPIMKLLANGGANVNAREGRSGYSSLHYAVEMRAESVVKFLCETCIDSLNLDYENYGGLTAFQLSLLTNQEALAEYLVKKGASPFYTPESDFDDDDDDDIDDDDVSISDYDEMEKNQLVNKIAEIAVN
jgi:ankyrin only family protein